VALVVGFGRIGRQIGFALQALGLEVHGFVRTPRADADFFPQMIKLAFGRRPGY